MSQRTRGGLLILAGLVAPVLLVLGPMIGNALLFGEELSSDTTDALAGMGVLFYLGLLLPGAAIYARSKGYPRWLGVVGGLFLIVLIVLLFLPERHPTA